jgi:hypothetical protein
MFAILASRCLILPGLIETTPSFNVNGNPVDSYSSPSTPLQEGKDFLPRDAELAGAKRRQ